MSALIGNSKGGSRGLSLKGQIATGRTLRGEPLSIAPNLTPRYSQFLPHLIDPLRGESSLPGDLHWRQSFAQQLANKCPTLPPIILAARRRSTDKSPILPELTRSSGNGLDAHPKSLRDLWLRRPRLRHNNDPIKLIGRQCTDATSHRQIAAQLECSRYAADLPFLNA
ncbi:MAG: hypothetical protein PF961_11940 [Planctomycetota bacterium]|nr:hypothetical protein [Planctomycetota bacterium]